MGKIYTGTNEIEEEVSIPCNSWKRQTLRELHLPVKNLACCFQYPPVIASSLFLFRLFRSPQPQHALWFIWGGRAMG